MASERYDFEKGVADILFRKVGGRCSAPRCQKPAMGPSADGSKAVNMGVACHIYSAAKNGPRGQAGKDEKYIRSEENGIWCCGYHADLIDKDKGRDYTPGTLLAWKKLAEARILKQMNDIPSSLGWVDSVGFTYFPIGEITPKVTLSRRTLIMGNNGSGKSSLMRIAASISHSKYGLWFTDTKIKKEVDKYENALFMAKTVYSTVDALRKVVDIEICGYRITRFENGNRCLLPPGDVEIIYCSGQDIKSDLEDDLDYFSRILDVDKSAINALTEIGTKTVFPGSMKFKHDNYYDENDVSVKMFKKDGSPHYALFFKKIGHADYMPYSALSSSGQSRLIIDLFITKAREVFKQRLTLVFIDQLHCVLDQENFEKLLKALSNEEFQVAITLPPNREKDVVVRNDGGIYLQKHEYLYDWSIATIE